MYWRERLTKLGTDSGPPADRAGGHVDPFIAFYFSYGISNLAPRDEIYTPKSCPVAPLQTQKELMIISSTNIIFSIPRGWFSSNLFKGIVSKFVFLFLLPKEKQCAFK